VHFENNKSIKIEQIFTFTLQLQTLNLTQRRKFVSGVCLLQKLQCWSTCDG